MLNFVQNFFAPKSSPIGVDFGSDSLRLAQVTSSGGELRLVAAACADVPAHIRHDGPARLNFFVETTRDLLIQGKFRGRHAVLGLPAASMFIQHLRMPKLDDDAMKKALPWELRGKLPIDPTHAQLRHIVAGDVYEGQDPKSEVIVIAAAREMVSQFLAAAAKAKLDVVGMNIEPRAIVDCFNQIYRRKTDEGAINCFVDIGCTATRAVIACGQEILFARTIPVGGDHFSRATSNALKIKLDEARLLRVKIAQALDAVGAEARRETAALAVDAPVAGGPAGQAAAEENSFALLSASMPKEKPAAKPAPLEESPAAAHGLDPALAAQARQVDQACREPLHRLIEELELCRRYYETTFQDRPVSRLIFVGGEARQKGLCQQIARGMGLAAQIGDPLARLAKNSDIGIESGIDRRQPQPGWAVAVGLSMGLNVGARAQAGSN